MMMMMMMMMTMTMMMMMMMMMIVVVVVVVGVGGGGGALLARTERMVDGIWRGNPSWIWHPHLESEDYQCAAGRKRRSVRKRPRFVTKKKRHERQLWLYHNNWLVVWNMFYFSIYWE